MGLRRRIKCRIKGWRESVSLWWFYLPIQRRLLKKHLCHTLCDHERYSINMSALEEGGVQPEFERASRTLFYPRFWEKEAAQRPPIVDHMVKCVGVTEADVRDMRYIPSHDGCVIRTWNWRKFYVTGQHIFEHEHDHY